MVGESETSFSSINQALASVGLDLLQMRNVNELRGEGDPSLAQLVNRKRFAPLARVNKSDLLMRSNAPEVKSKVGQRKDPNENRTGRFMRIN